MFLEWYSKYKELQKMQEVESKDAEFCHARKFDCKFVEVNMKTRRHGLDKREYLNITSKILSQNKYSSDISQRITLAITKLY